MPAPALPGAGIVFAAQAVLCDEMETTNKSLCYAFVTNGSN
jgi:hypothetical protein